MAQEEEPKQQRKVSDTVSSLRPSVEGNIQDLEAKATCEGHHSPMVWLRVSQLMVQILPELKFAMKLYSTHLMK